MLRRGRCACDRRAASSLGAGARSGKVGHTQRTEAHGEQAQDPRPPVVESACAGFRLSLMAIEFYPGATPRSGSIAGDSTFPRSDVSGAQTGPHHG